MRGSKFLAAVMALALGAVDMRPRGPRWWDREPAMAWASPARPPATGRRSYAARKARRALRWGKRIARMRSA